MYKVYALLIGMVIAVMVAFNGALAGGTGDYIAGAMIHLSGLFGVILILLLTKRSFRIPRGIPIYLFSSGAIGVLTILFNNLCFKAFGVSLTLALGLFGQSLAAGIIDHFGLLGMKQSKIRKEKILGFVIIAAGIIMMYVL